jgi:hypothetical protein
MYKDKTSDMKIELSRDLHSLIFEDLGIVYKVSKDKFKIMNTSNISLEFMRNANEDVISLLLIVKPKNETDNDSIRNYKLIKIK